MLTSMATGQGQTALVGIPKNSEWGPLLWTLLHGGVEKMGSSAIRSILDDQRREFILVLKTVEGIMPCALCRNHFREFRMKQSIDKLPVDPSEFKIASRKWLFDLHDAVNERNQRPWVLTVDMLPSLYASSDLIGKSQELYRFLEGAVRVRAIEGELFKKFKTHYALFLRYCR
jgi:hypothetical protein